MYVALFFYGRYIRSNVDICFCNAVYELYICHILKKDEHCCPPYMFSQRNNPYCDLLSKTHL
jgi:hypothetical protein